MKLRRFIKKISWLLGLIFILIQISFAQLSLLGSYEDMEEQYNAWLSTPEAPTNQFNFVLKSKEDQKVFDEKKVSI